MLLHVGISGEAIYERVTNAFIMERTSVSTLPFGIDDPSADSSKQYNLSEVIVDLYNGGRTANSKKGVTNAVSLPLVAINHSLPQDERYTFIFPTRCERERSNCFEL